MEYNHIQAFAQWELRFWLWLTQNKNREKEINKIENKEIVDRSTKSQTILFKKLNKQPLARLNEIIK